MTRAEEEYLRRIEEALPNLSNDAIQELDGMVWQEGVNRRWGIYWQQ